MLLEPDSRRRQPSGLDVLSKYAPSAAAIRTCLTDRAWLQCPQAVCGAAVGVDVRCGRAAAAVSSPAEPAAAINLRDGGKPARTALMRSWPHRTRRHHRSLVDDSGIMLIASISVVIERREVAGLLQAGSAAGRASQLLQQRGTALPTGSGRGRCPVARSRCSISVMGSYEID